MRKYRNRILAGFVIGFAIYVVLLLLADAEGLTEDLVALLLAYPWLLIVPLILQKFGSWFFRFLEWHYFLGVIEARDKISLFDSAILYLAGFTMAVSPGKVAEVLKAVVLKSKTGVPIARSAPVIIAERVVDGLAVLILSLMCLLLAGDGIDVGPYRPLIIVSTALLAGGLIAVQIRPLAYLVLGIVARLPLVKRAHDWMAHFYESSHEIFKLKHMIPTTGFGMIASLGDAVGFVIILAGFGVEITWLTFLQAMVIVGLASAIGALSGVPNGAGITEISVSAMLMIIVAPANPLVTPAVAAAAALVEGFFHKWFRVIVGMGVALIFRYRLFAPDIEAEIAAMERGRKRGRVELGTEVSGA
jgi:glycosyltransferase 2 family protein